MASCAFCGRENDAASKFCIDCGKPVVASGARVIPVPQAGGGASAAGGVQGHAGGAQAHAAAEGGRFSVPQTRVSKSPVRGSDHVAAKTCRYCSAPIDPSMPFCPRCGGRVVSGPNTTADTASTALCGSCGSKVTPGVDVFCARCGARVAVAASPPAAPAGTATFSARGTVPGPRIAVLDAEGQTERTVTLEGSDATIGRADGDQHLRFPDDVFMSPVHAQLSWRGSQLTVRDLGSRNGTWLFTDAPYKLQDGDTVLIGSQLLRFRRLGYPGPHPPEADATRRLGSATPSADVAVLQQLRSDGSARDVCHLSPARSVVIGRTEGDWLFPYDGTMSGRHAEVRSEDLEFIVLDLGSRNGIAVAVRGEKPVHAGQRILLGDQTLRVESV